MLSKKVLFGGSSYFSQAQGGVPLSLCFWKNMPLGRAGVWRESLGVGGLGRIRWGLLQGQGLGPAVSSWGP